MDALDGAPGLHSARYAPQPGATDADRRALMIQNLRGLPQPWTARFRCTVAVATPEGALQLTEGTCEGEIIPEERGSNGFGYDPIFLLTDLGLHHGRTHPPAEEHPLPPRPRRECSHSAVEEDD